MPVTPFHAGYPIIAGLLARSWFSLPAAVIGSVIIDLEPLFRILLGFPTSHGPFHSFLLAVVVGLVLGAFVFVFRGRFDRLTAMFGLKQTTTLRSAYIGALFGTLSHIVLDFYMHPAESGFKAFWPFSEATFYDPAAPLLITAASIVVLLAAFLLYALVVVRGNKQ